MQHPFRNYENPTVSFMPRLLPPFYLIWAIYLFTVVSLRDSPLTLLRSQLSKDLGVNIENMESNERSQRIHRLKTFLIMLSLILPAMELAEYKKQQQDEVMELRHTLNVQRPLVLHDVRHHIQFVVSFSFLENSLLHKFMLLFISLCMHSLANCYRF